MPGKVADHVKSYNDRELLAKLGAQPQRRQQQQQRPGIGSSGGSATEPPSGSGTRFSGPCHDDPKLQSALSSIVNELGGGSTTLTEQIPPLIDPAGHVAATPNSSETVTGPPQTNSSAIKDSFGRRSTQIFQTAATRRTSRAWERQQGQGPAGLAYASAGYVKGTHPEHPEHSSHVKNSVGRIPCPHHKHAAWEGSESPTESGFKPAAVEQRVKEPRGSDDNGLALQKDASMSPRTIFARLNAKEQRVAPVTKGPVTSDRNSFTNSASDAKLQEPNVITVTVKTQPDHDEKSEPITPLNPGQDGKIEIHAESQNITAHQEHVPIGETVVPSLAPTSSDSAVNCTGEAVITSAPRSTDAEPNYLSTTTEPTPGIAPAKDESKLESQSVAAAVASTTGTAFEPCHESSRPVTLNTCPPSAAVQTESIASNTPNIAAAEKNVLSARQVNPDEVSEPTALPTRTASTSRSRVDIPETEISVQKNADGKASDNARILSGRAPHPPSPGTDLNSTHLLPHEKAVERIPTNQTLIFPAPSRPASSTSGDEQLELQKSARSTPPREIEMEKVSTPELLTFSSSRNNSTSSTSGDKQGVSVSSTTIVEVKDGRDIAIETAIDGMNTLLVKHRAALQVVSSTLAQGLKRIDANLKEIAPTEQELRECHEPAAKVIPEVQRQTALLSQLLNLIDESVADWNQTSIADSIPVVSEQADREQGIRAKSLQQPSIPVPSPLRGATSTPDLSRSRSIQTLFSAPVSTVEVLPLGSPVTKCYIFPMCHVTVRPYRNGKYRDSSSSNWADDSSFWSAYGSA